MKSSSILLSPKNHHIHTYWLDYIKFSLLLYLVHKLKQGSFSYSMCVWPPFICLCSKRTLQNVFRHPLPLTDTSHLLCKLLFCHDKRNGERWAGGCSLIFISLEHGRHHNTRQWYHTQLLHSDDIPLQILEDIKKLYQQWATSHCFIRLPVVVGMVIVEKSWTKARKTRSIQKCFIVLFFSPITKQFTYEGAKVNHKAPCGICKQSLRAVCFPLGAYVL